MQKSPSYIFSTFQKFFCPRCEFLLNSTVHIPIVAPCGHTFCNVCIEEEYLEKQKFRCDLCQAETTEHFSSFPTNFYILKIFKEKIKNESIYRGGKSPIQIKDTVHYKKITRSNSSNTSITYSFNGNHVKKNLYKFYQIKNEITYKFINNKLEIIKREIEYKKLEEENARKENFNNISNSKNNYGRYRRMSSGHIESKSEYKDIENILKNKKDLTEIMDKKIEVIDFYGEDIIKKPRYPPLYNYFELLKKIFKFGDKYNRKYCNQIFKFIFRVLMISILLSGNIYLIKYIDVALFFLFVNIYAEKENTIYEISTKVKMLLALNCFYFMENILNSLGLEYLSEMSSYISNICNGTRTIFNLLVLGNDSTLNLIVFTILNILSNLHLLLN